MVLLSPGKIVVPVASGTFGLALLVMNPALVVIRTIHQFFCGALRRTSNTEAVSLSPRPARIAAV